MKKITIIIPCYNVESYLDRCFNSIYNQTIGFENIEIIMIDDCSNKDNTWASIQELESKYSDNIIAIHLEQNMRLGTARNIGLEYATSPFIMFVDADDWLDEYCLEKMYAYMLSDNFDVVTCNFYRDWGNGKYIECKKNDFNQSIYVNDIDTRSNLILYDSLQTRAWGKLIRKDFLIDNNILFPDKLLFEDIPWSSLIYLYVSKAYVMSECFYHYFVNPTSTILSSNQKSYRDAFDCNYIKWNNLISYKDFDKISEAVCFDFLVNYYLLILKMLGKKHEAILKSDFDEMQQFIKNNIPEYKTNKYINSLLSPELAYLFNFIEFPLSANDLVQLHTIIHNMNI